jgi:uncharacterized protein (DUF362 family)
MQAFVSRNGKALSPIVSMSRQKGLKYPQEFPYSPDVAYPEYRHGALSSDRNLVYAALRHIFVMSGLDFRNANRPNWNPLGDFVRPGSRVFVLCNFVYHRRKAEDERRFFAKCTHPSVIRALVDYLLLAVGRGGSVTIGNAPLQSCIWEKVVDDTRLSALVEFYKRNTDIPVEMADLRLYVGERSVSGAVSRTEVREEKDAILVDLGRRSLLDPLGETAFSKFRISDYDPELIKAYHSEGRHVYAINRRIVESDTIVSIPKLKTHVKVGVTAAIKGCVGAIGRKECLAHYTQGAPLLNGDEFPVVDVFRRQFRNRLSEFHDAANRMKPAGFGNVLRMLDRNVRRSLGLLGSIQGGGWPGNDTAWRMALDVARVIRYATKNGDLANTEQRKHLMLTDGIIGGQAEGPLSPTPVNAGMLIFSEDIAVGDLVNCLAMGFDPFKVPLIRESFSIDELQLTEYAPMEIDVLMNGTMLPAFKIPDKVPVRFSPPRSWKDSIELNV